MNFYRELASALQAKKNCDENGNREWKDKHSDAIDDLLNNHAPSGSGFDRGTQLDEDKSTRDKLVFVTAFHHMDENGSYDGWTNHTVTVRPAFYGFDIHVGGRNRNDIKEFIANVFNTLGDEK